MFSPDLVGIDHVAIHVKDLETSFKWYEKVLGLHLLHKWTTTWMIGRGNVKLGLFQHPNAIPLPDANQVLVIQHFALGMDADKFDVYVEALRTDGLISEGVEDSGIAFSVFLNDPDGHTIEITAYHA